MSNNSKQTYTIKRRPLWLNLLLTAVTFGLYQWIWFYIVLKDSDRITEKRRKIFPLFWAMIVLIYVGAVFAIIALYLIISYGKVLGFNFFNLLSFNFFFVIAEMEVSKAIAVYLLSVFGSLAAICGIVLEWIILFRLARNLDTCPVYYIVPAFLFGLWIPCLYAQAYINDYAGTYDKGTRATYIYAK